MHALVSLALVVGAASAPASDKAPSFLADLVDSAEFICIGRVTAIIDLPPSAGWDSNEGPQVLRLARVHVESVLKGRADTRVAYHEAWSTWDCDTTSAEVGQRALFLLGPGTIARASQAVRDTVAHAVDHALVLRNVGSGDGIIDIVEEFGEELVVCCSVPDTLRITGKSQWCSARLADVRPYVEELSRFSPEVIAVHAVSIRTKRDRSTDLSFELRILADGSCRLARPLGFREEEVRSFQLSAGAWEALKRDLVPLLAMDAECPHVVPDTRVNRRLLVRLPTGTLCFHEFDWVLPLPSTIENEERLLWRGRLLAWALVRGAIDCPECDDSREQDRQWINK